MPKEDSPASMNALFSAAQLCERGLRPKTGEQPAMVETFLHLSRERTRQLWRLDQAVSFKTRKWDHARATPGKTRPDTPAPDVAPPTNLREWVDAARANRQRLEDPIMAAKEGRTPICPHEILYGPSVKRDKTEIATLLDRLRVRQQERWATLGVGCCSQMAENFSLAYACGRPPLGWEVLVSPVQFQMPSTEFFGRHKDEVEEALAPRLTWALLQEYAGPKLATAQKWLLVFDPSGVWRKLDIPIIEWFDRRDGMRKELETFADRNARLATRIERQRAYNVKYPSQGGADSLAAMERNLHARAERDAGADEEAIRRQLAQLEASPDFAKALSALVRDAENEVRANHGIAAVGEGWVSETELYYRVRELLAGIEVVQHGQPKWLGLQHLDIWIPSLSVAIEYHGAQHFQPVDFFGGEEAFQRSQERDQRKRALCEANNVRLIEIAHDDPFMEDTPLMAHLRGGAA